MGLAPYLAEMNIFSSLKVSVCFGWMFSWFFLLHCCILLFQFYSFCYGDSVTASIFLCRGCLLHGNWCLDKVLLVQTHCTRRAVGRSEGLSCRGTTDGTVILLVFLQSQQHLCATPVILNSLWQWSFFNNWKFPSDIFNINIDMFLQPFSVQVTCTPDSVCIICINA